MAQEPLVGFTEDTAGRVLDATRFIEADPRYPVSDRRNGGPPSREPVLMLALADFGLTAGATTGAVLADRDCLVAYCIPLERNQNVGVDATGIVAQQTYFPAEGQEAVPVYAALTGRSGDATGCAAKSIKCGARLWAIFSPWSERWEVVSIDEGFPATSSCSCTWRGWALWKVVWGEGEDPDPEWELESNHCIGCEANLDGAQDLRFAEIEDETDLEEPGIDPPESWIGTDRRYVTCCGVTDVPSECPQCCYSLSFPLPDCEGGTNGTLQLVLDGGGGPGAYSCMWDSGEEQRLLADLPCLVEGGTLNILIRAKMYATTNFLFIWITYMTTEGLVTHQARYAVTGDIDCSQSLTATFDNQIKIGTGTWFCEGCEIDFEELFPETLEITLAESCNTTTGSTTTTTTESTTTASTTTTTTESTTTTTTESTTTTTESTTTSSTSSTTTTSESTTTSSTGSSTTTTTTTPVPCSGGCTYIGDGAGGWSYVSDNCTVTCDPCETNSAALVAEFGPSDGPEDELVIPCNLA